MSQAFLKDRAAVLADAAQRIVLYHSSNDRALKAASIIFNSVRAGRHGINPMDLDAPTADRLEAIDATDVAEGWMRHSPHIDSPEVIGDLYSLFQGHRPEERVGLRPVSTARWTIHSATAR